MTISTLFVAWVVMDSLFVATLKYLAFLSVNQREIALTARTRPPREPVARRVETYQGTTDRCMAGRAAKIQIPSERTHVMTEMTLPNVEDLKEEVTVNPAALASVTPPIKKMHILIIYAESDRKHFQGLDQHLQPMYGRLGNQARHYFAYRTIEEPKPYTGDSQYFKEQYEKEKAAYEEDLKNYTGHHNTMVRYLKQEQLLLILYVSNSLMEYLKTDQTPELRTLLNNPNHRIAPVLITPTAGMASNCEPLCAFSGVAFETACQHIATTIEAIARDYFGPDLVLPDTTPFALLTSPSAIHVSLPSEHDRMAQMFAGLQSMFEQAHTRMVESQQQLMLAERSQRETLQESEAELRKQLGEMEQRLTAHEIRQNASMGAKLRRLFGIHSPQVGSDH